MTDTSRAAFEAWARKQPRYPINDPDFDLDSDQKRYKNHTVQGDWETWQASRKAALEDAAQMCDRKGYLAPWLEAKKTAADDARLLCEYIAAAKAANAP